MAKIWNLSAEQLEGDPHISEIVESARAFFPADTDWPKLKQRIILVVTERSVRSGRLQRADGHRLLIDGVGNLPAVQHDPIREQGPIRHSARLSAERPIGDTDLRDPYRVPIP